MKESEMGFFSGSTVTYRAGRPKPETATATLASPPPKVARNCGDCRKRSKPGGARRSMISPKVTISLDISRYSIASALRKAKGTWPMAESQSLKHITFNSRLGANWASGENNCCLDPAKRFEDN